MRSYSTFHFSGYSWNHHAGKITLKYSLDDSITFEELVLLPEPVSDERLKEKAWEIERLLFALHLIGGVSYYKTCLPRNIKVSSGELKVADAKFWNTVYENGLGEFFFRNNIDYRGLVKFPLVTQKEAPNPEKIAKVTSRFAVPLDRPARILVPIGGGKDSMVTIELLRKSGANITLLRLGNHPLIDDIADATGLPMLTIRRTLSESLFDLNDEGALNGHVPITAYLSILSVLVALIYDYDAVAMSNEHSASFGNVEYKGLEINHQWSKSIAFEKLLRRYLTETVGTHVDYYSALRPFSELKITEMFSKYPQYFGQVTSCNRNWKILETKLETRNSKLENGRWCNHCPKCAFVFTCLAAFLDKSQLEKMFGANLFGDESLIPLFRELLGVENFKPFECVGTPEETKAAFLLAHKRKDLNDTPVMKMFIKEVMPTIKDKTGLIDDALKPKKEHFIPQSLQSFILA